MPDYKALGFYQKAREVTKGVDAVIKTWPRTMQAQEISRQLFRAAASVGANIAEGHGRHTGPEYIHNAKSIREHSALYSITDELSDLDDLELEIDERPQY